jgi:hypothetical protein
MYQYSLSHPGPVTSVSVHLDTVAVSGGGFGVRLWRGTAQVGRDLLLPPGEVATCVRWSERGEVGFAGSLPSI